MKKFLLVLVLAIGLALTLAIGLVSYDRYQSPNFVTVTEEIAELKIQRAFEEAKLKILQEIAEKKPSDAMNRRIQSKEGDIMNIEMDALSKERLLRTFKSN